MTAKQKPMLVIVGPTASGKTELAIKLAEKFDGEIICADSRTVYKGMDIGTAKPTAQQQVRVKHYGLGLVEPCDPYSVYDFQQYAYKVIEKIKSKGKLPILVGGSGLFIDAVLYGYRFRNSNQELDFSKFRDEDLIVLVKQKFPQEFKKIDVKNRRRVEQLLSRGPSNTADRKSMKIPALIFGLNPKRAILKEKIENRAEVIMGNDFVQELKQLRKKYGSKCPALQTISYRHMAAFLDHNIDLDEAKRRIVNDEFALARRQMTWFKRNKSIIWIEEPQEAEKLVTKYMLEQVQ